MKKGFTLVELILSFSLMMVLAGGMFLALGQGLRSWRKIVDRNERLQIKNLVAERMTRDFRFAERVLAGSGSQEIVFKVGGDQISYQLVRGKVRRKKGMTAAYLTSEDEIKTLSFSYPAVQLVEVALDGLSWKVYLRN